MPGRPSRSAEPGTPSQARDGAEIGAAAEANPPPRLRAVGPLREGSDAPLRVRPPEIALARSGGSRPGLRSGAGGGPGPLGALGPSIRSAPTVPRPLPDQVGDPPERDLQQIGQRPEKQRRGYGVGSSGARPDQPADVAELDHTKPRGGDGERRYQPGEREDR